MRRLTVVLALLVVSATCSKSNKMSGAEIQAALAGLPGSGSRVDADTVDGKHAADFAAAAHTHPGTDITSKVAAATAADTVPWSGVTGAPAAAPRVVVHDADGNDLGPAYALSGGSSGVQLGTMEVLLLEQPGGPGTQSALVWRSVVGDLPSSLETVSTVTWPEGSYGLGILTGTSDWGTRWYGHDGELGGTWTVAFGRDNGWSYAWILNAANLSSSSSSNPFFDFHLLVYDAIHDAVVDTGFTGSPTDLYPSYPSPELGPYTGT